MSSQGDSKSMNMKRILHLLTALLLTPLAALRAGTLTTWGDLTP